MASAKIGRPTRGSNDAKKVVYFSNEDLTKIAGDKNQRGSDRQVARNELRKRGVEV